MAETYNGNDLDRLADLSDRLTAKNISTKTFVGKMADLGGMQSNVSEIDGSVNAHSQLSKIETKLVEGIENLKIFVTSDSTGNSDVEWVHNFTEWISLNYTNYTTYWYEWDVDNNIYKTPVSFGSGSVRCDVFSYGIGGSRPDHLYNTFETSVEDIINESSYPNTSKKVDLIICNHGHNLYDTETVENVECRFADVIEVLLQIFADAGVVLFLQNPRETNNDGYVAREAVVNYATRRNFAIANVYKLFMDLDKDASLYADFIHPNANGQALFLQAITKLLVGARYKNGISNVSLFNNNGLNILKNSKFETWSNTSIAPDFFTAVGLTNTKDTVNYEDRIRASSWKIETTGAGNYISMGTVLCNAVRAKGKYVTVGMRYKYNSGTPVGGLTAQFMTEPLSLSYGFSMNPNRWFWKTWSIFVPYSENLKFTIFPDGSTSNGYSINIDRMFITIGKNQIDI